MAPTFDPAPDQTNVLALDAAMQAAPDDVAGQGIPPAGFRLA